MKRFVVCLSFLLVLFLFALPVFAQDSASPIPPDVMTPEQAATLGFQTLLAVISAFVGSGLTAAIVGGLKYFVPPEWDTGLMKNVIGGLLTVVYWLAVRYGFGNAFQSVAQFAIVAIPAFITLYGTLKGAPAIHEAASAVKLPLIGYDRTPEA